MKVHPLSNAIHHALKGSRPALTNVRLSANFLVYLWTQNGLLP